MMKWGLVSEKDLYPCQELDIWDQNFEWHNSNRPRVVAEIALETDSIVMAESGDDGNSL